MSQLSSEKEIDITCNYVPQLYFISQYSYTRNCGLMNVARVNSFTTIDDIFSTKLDIDERGATPKCNFGSHSARLLPLVCFDSSWNA